MNFNKLTEYNDEQLKKAGRCNDQNGHTGPFSKVYNRGNTDLKKYIWIITILGTPDSCKAF